MTMLAVNNFLERLRRKILKMSMLIKIGFVVFLLAYLFGFERGDLDKYGPFQNALNSRILTCIHDKNLNLDVSGIRIHFYDFFNNFNTSFPINTASEEILTVKNLNKSKQFIMFVGGFTSHIEHAVETQMREAYKTHPDSYLVIPDHSQYTNNNFGNIGGYYRAVSYVHYIGKALGQMWAEISLSGVSTRNIHFVGHSLGGQILGHAGTTFSELRGEKVWRVSALDPAGPCFVNSAAEEQVRAGVAEYVEVYHCNAGALGSANILGDVDFFVNKNGRTQPNCGTPLIPSPYLSAQADSCAHRTCVDLWTASVKHPELFMAYNCKSYKDFRKGQCLTHDRTIAGSANPGTAKGVYILSTIMYDLKSLM